MDTLPIIREISATPAEFERGVRAAFSDARVNSLAGATQWELAWQTARARVELSPIPELRIGGLCLPRLRCVINLSGPDDQHRQNLLQRLDRYQQRGGG
jgi:hypothetical protein